MQMFGKGVSYTRETFTDDGMRGDKPLRVNAELLIEYLEEVRRFVSGEAKLTANEVPFVEMKVLTVQVICSGCKSVAIAGEWARE